MNEFSKKHPILFGVLLFFAALLAAVPFSVLAGGVGAGEEGGAAGRLIVGCILLLLFRSCFRQGRPFSGLVWILPALLFPLWNIVYHLVCGMGTLKPAEALPAALLLGFAPAVFEEVIFRGILIAKLREHGTAVRGALWISSLLFGAAHLTNLVGTRLIDVLVQTGYAIVIGLVLGAIYLKSGDIAAAILAHALTDVSSRIFVSSPDQTPAPMLVAFVLLLIVEAGYALWLTKRIPDAREDRTIPEPDGEVDMNQTRRQKEAYKNESSHLSDL